MRDYFALCTIFYVFFFIFWYCRDPIKNSHAKRDWWSPVDITRSAYESVCTQFEDIDCVAHQTPQPTSQWWVVKMKTEQKKNKNTVQVSSKDWQNVYIAEANKKCVFVFLFLHSFARVPAESEIKNPLLMSTILLYALYLLLLILFFFHFFVVCFLLFITSISAPNINGCPSNRRSTNQQAVSVAHAKTVAQNIRV